MAPDKNLFQKEGGRKSKQYLVQKSDQENKLTGKCLWKKVQENKSQTFA